MTFAVEAMTTEHAMGMHTEGDPRNRYGSKASMGCPGCVFAESGALVVMIPDECPERDPADDAFMEELLAAIVEPIDPGASSGCCW